VSDYYECPGDADGKNVGGDCEWVFDSSWPCREHWVIHGKSKRFEMRLSVTCRHCGIQLDGSLDAEVTA